MAEKTGTQPGRNGGTLNKGGGGRPKGSVSIVSALKKELAKGATASEVAKAIIEQAKSGNGVAIKAVLDRIDGPVKNEIDADMRVVVEFADFKAYANDEDNSSDSA